MRVVAATFPDARAAGRVLSELRDRYRLGPGDARVAPMGTAGSDYDEGTALLAGRFRDDRVSEVEQLIEQRGGEVIVEVPERWTV